MFSHYFKYAIKHKLRSKESIFWSLIFPIALASFMFMAFGNVYNNTEVFKSIKTAIVTVNDNKIFLDVVEKLSVGDNKLLEPEYTDEEKALELLNDKEVYGVIYVDDKIHMTVREEGYEATILSSFLNQYNQKQSLIESIAATNPAALADGIEAITEASVNACNELSTSNGNQDNLVNYFYAIFAMSCLFAAFSGNDITFALQANITSLGARRATAPTHKSIIIIAEVLASSLIQFVTGCIALLFMWLVLGIDFGDKIPAILPLLYVGSACGLAIGMIIGALPKPASEGAKIGITVAFTMVLSVLADLCANGIKDLIEHNIPIINRLNPAALISDAFYSLNVYDTYTRYLGNLALLGIITVVLCVISFFMIRRNRYASL
jgi:ABC-2 type transport system permease protein